MLMILLLNIFETTAHAILPIVTAVEARAIVHDNTSGIVLPDMDIDAWAAAITDLADKPQKRALRPEDRSTNLWKNTR